MAFPFPVNPGDELPIYRQLMRQVIEGVAGGHLRPGDQLPSQREVAALLVISPLTVKKAYDELEHDGYIRTARGHGTFVSAEPPALAEGEKSERVRATVRRLVREAYLVGLSPARLRALLDEETAALRDERRSVGEASPKRRRA
jgi:GntR family transcriptional regulator